MPWSHRCRVASVQIVGATRKRWSRTGFDYRGRMLTIARAENMDETVMERVGRTPNESV